MMKMHPIRSRAALLVGAALLSTPAFAQETPAPQSVTPPPILVTPTPAPQPAPRVEMAPASPIVQPAPPPGPAPEAAPAPRAETRAASRPAPARQVTRTTTTTRQTTPARATAPAAAPAAPVEAPAPAAQAPAAPVPTAVTPAPEAAAPVADTTATQTEAVRSTGLAWPWLLGGLLLVLAGGLALLMMRRRRSETDYVEEAMYEAPIAPRTAAAPVEAAPLAAAPEPRREPVSPVLAAAAPAAIPAAPAPELAEAHVEAELTEAESEDLAGITDAPAPVANRPWLELGLRPVRAGTSEEEALVDVELTVGNSGDVPARDVQISAFMLADAEGSEMESLLTRHAADTAVPPVTIAPGDGTRVDAHLAVPKGEMGRTFNPVVVAEARYTLPDGREGRTSAAFKIGRPSAVSEGVGPIGASRPHMVDDVEAELLGAPEHA